MVGDGGGCEGPTFSVKVISDRRQSEATPALPAPSAIRLQLFLPAGATAPSDRLLMRARRAALLFSLWFIGRGPITVRSEEGPHELRRAQNSTWVYVAGAKWRSTLCCPDHEVLMPNRLR
jgi:hypothetical protein